MPSKKNSPPDSDALPFGAGTFETQPQGGAREARGAEPRRESTRKEGDERRSTRPASRAADAARARPVAESSAKALAESTSDSRSEPAAREAGEAPQESEGRESRRGGRRRRGRGRGPGERSGREPVESAEGAAPAEGAEDEGSRAQQAPLFDEADGSRDAGHSRSEGDAPEGDAAEGDEEGEPGDGSPDPGSSGEPSAGPQGGPVDPSAPPRRSGRAERRRRWQERRRRRRLGLPLDDLAPQGGAPSAPAHSGRPGAQPHGGHSGPRPPAHGGAPGGQAPRERPQPQHPQPQQELREVEGLLVLDKGNHGELRRREADFLPSKDDVSVAPWQVQKFALRDGALVRGNFRRGQGRSRWELVDVLAVDGRDPREARNVPNFKSLVTIDPDFHYALGDGSGEVSLKVVDVICPIGRGQRGLIVAPPRSGKTILLQQISKAIEKIYPDVHLMVLLIDERPEEATEWKRTVEHGEVYVSTNDEPAKKHVELAEVVWRRARRLVELGKDVVLLLDSITRLGRAANNVWGTSGKTMSGGIDSRALERPKALFGSARNTEKAGSLTILGTTLVDTGSRMDQIIFEEFKGTGNMELVLSRKLADRRIFPAIDLERSGTRKDEKLHSAKRLARCNTLRRVLMRMHFAEAMELLITKLGDVDKIDDFLQRFDIDPDAGDEGKQAVSPVRMRW